MRLIPGVVGSVAGHAVLVVTLLIAQSCAPKHAPLINPDEVMEVSLLSMPKQETRMVQKATRAPEEKQGVQEPEPVEVIKTDSDMRALEVTPDKGQEKPSRDDALREMKRAEMLAALEDAAEGSQDRLPTSEDGVEGSEGSSKGVGDPRLAAYYEKVKKAVLPNFRPLQEDPALKVKLHVTVDRKGTVLGFEVADSSGDVSFDQAAIRAVKATDTVPAPPEDLMPGDTATLTMVLTPKDAK
jgi:TonB family protein